jgi:hypothetical protein
MMGYKGLFYGCGCCLFWITSMSIHASFSFWVTLKRALACAPRSKARQVAYGIDPD